MLWLMDSVHYKDEKRLGFFASSMDGAVHLYLQVNQSMETP